jgi:hypothetical protein
VTRKGIDGADHLADVDTADGFTEETGGIDNWLWFVEAHQQDEAVTAKPCRLAVADRRESTPTSTPR